jgi:hypothetical protein
MAGIEGRKYMKDNEEDPPEYIDLIAKPEWDADGDAQKKTSAPEPGELGH